MIATALSVRMFRTESLAIVDVACSGALYLAHVARRADGRVTVGLVAGANTLRAIKSGPRRSAIVTAALDAVDFAVTS